MKKFVLFATLLLVIVALTACAAPTPTPAPKPTDAPKPTAVPPTAVPATKAPEPTKPPEATKPPAPTATTAAPAPTATQAAAAKPTVPVAKCDPVGAPIAVKAGDLGSADKPIVMSFVPSGDVARITKGGQDIGDCLKKMYGLNFRIEVGTTFAASIEAMGANKAQVGFLNTFSVLLARAKYDIEPALAVMRRYNTNAIDPDKADAGKLTAYYKGQFIAKKDSGIKGYADLKGKTFCFVDPNSTSGYIIPNIILKANGINSEKDLKAVQNAGSHNNVGLAVYKGDCDAGVTFIDVLTDAAANLKATYPDIADKVVAFAVTDKIPNDGVQFVKGFDPALKKAITDGLVAMAKDPGGNVVLRSIYSIDDFQVINATFYDEFSGVLKKAGVDPASLVK
ncbi:MAG: phosphate/phosphite/phosphonate ABC transporter substrate-binding protein [Chloroflexi bacterium]|nr:phosphate/phosphite/phosphonate ABC transporter substrate-binding protein [Chloroflexota bacterium]